MHKFSNSDVLSHYLLYVKCVIFMFHCELLQYIYLHGFNNKKTLNVIKLLLNLRGGTGKGIYLEHNFVWC